MTSTSCCPIVPAQEISNRVSILWERLLFEVFCRWRIENIICSSVVYPLPCVTMGIAKPVFLYQLIPFTWEEGRVKLAMEGQASMKDFARSLLENHVLLWSNCDLSWLPAFSWICAVGDIDFPPLALFCLLAF